MFTPYLFGVSRSNFWTLIWDAKKYLLRFCAGMEAPPAPGAPARPGAARARAAAARAPPAPFLNSWPRRLVWGSLCWNGGAGERRLGASNVFQRNLVLISSFLGRAKNPSARSILAPTPLTCAALPSPPVPSRPNREGVPPWTQSMGGRRRRPGSISQA